MFSVHTVVDSSVCSEEILCSVCSGGSLEEFNRTAVNSSSPALISPNF